MVSFFVCQAELFNALYINPEFLSKAQIKNLPALDADQLFYSFCLGNNYEDEGENGIDQDAVTNDDNREGKEFINKRKTYKGGRNDAKKRPRTIEEKRNLEKGRFVKWLKKTIKPSHQRIFGEGQLNPVIFFHLTKLSPGYVGGVISGLTYRVFYC